MLHWLAFVVLGLVVGVLAGRGRGMVGALIGGLIGGLAGGWGLIALLGYGAAKYPSLLGAVVLAGLLGWLGRGIGAPKA